MAGRIFALSDIHVDYDCNAQWIAGLSPSEYRSDVLILAGDVSDSVARLEWTLKKLVALFKHVLFVPGNHELWVVRDDRGMTSFDKFDQVHAVVDQCGASMQPFHDRELSIIPLFGWYDYSFGQPSPDLLAIWGDYRACRWPDHFEIQDIASHFEKLNDRASDIRNDFVVTFSHFLPRIDLIPEASRRRWQILYPVLGSARLDDRIRALKAAMHVYGHSHVHRRLHIDGVTYVNNALGYPHESWGARRELVCIHSA